MCGVVRKSCRRTSPVDYLVNKKTADWSPSTCAEVQRVNSDSRRAQIKDEAAHFQEEDAKREGLSLHVRPGGSVLYRGYAYQPPAAFTDRRRRAAGVAGAPGGWWAGSPLGAHGTGALQLVGPATVYARCTYAYQPQACGVLTAYRGITGEYHPDHPNVKRDHARAAAEMESPCTT